LTLKPDLGAPGGSIYSTYPLEQGGYALASGTSMAAPHVAGSVALMLEADPNLTPAAVLSRLQNTAEPAPVWLNPGLGILDAAHHQGAGLIQVDEAITGTTWVSPGKISAGESEKGPHTTSLTVQNTGSADHTYRFSYQPALATWSEGNQNAPGFFLAESDVRFSSTELRVPAGAQRSVEVSIAPEAGLPDGMVYTGYLVISAAEGETVVTVPFAGMSGDYGGLPVLTDPAGLGTPSLARIVKCEIFAENQCVDADAEFDLVDANHVFHGGTDLPTIIAHFDQPVRQVRVDILSTLANGRIKTNVAPRHAFTVDYVGRDAGYSAWTWDGMVDGRNGRVDANPGRYVMVMTITTADGENEQVFTTEHFRMR
nr:S8 family serine peptidase [Actinomycetales bacterium]